MEHGSAEVLVQVLESENDRMIPTIMLHSVIYFKTLVTMMISGTVNR